MNDPTLWVTAAVAGLAGLVVVTHGALKGWRGWLDLKRFEIDGRREGGSPSSASRIEIADLKERVRKLEAIAAGVDL